MRVPSKQLVALGVVTVAIVTVALILGIQQVPRGSTDIVALVEDVRAGRVETIVEERSGRTATVIYVDPEAVSSRVSVPAGTSLTAVFETASIPVADWPTMQVARPSAMTQLSPILKFLLVIGVILGAFWFIRRAQGGMTRGGSRKGAFDPVKPAEQTVTMADVAGIEEVKEEIADVIDFLRDPEKFHRLGARIPRGALLIGPPGTGKTLIARAVAGEARASFFSVSGSEFVELYVGVGASRVRELFKRARECAPAIIFVDEIDAIGRKRGRAEHSSEYDQTLNQILVEMDGFDPRTTVVVLAATNRVDILDNALMRPGRFDRKVHVDLPDRAARASILRVHARGKPLATDVNLDELAARTTGMSGADLANIINEAAILCGRRNASEIDMTTLLEAIDRTVIGTARKSGRFSDREREIVAYHEAGHALVAHYLPDGDPVRKVSIVSRGRAGGYTMIVPEEDRGLWTRRQLTDRLAGLLGGYAAEQLVFGDVTTGSSNDLERVSEITLSMVARYGMGQAFGLLSAGEDDSRRGGFSQRTAFAAETEARDLVEAAFTLAHEVLVERRGELETLAQRLLEVESVEGDELIEMLGPAVTADLAPKLPSAPATLVPVRAARPANRTRRSSRIERLVSLPAAIVSVARVARAARPVIRRETGA